MGLALPAGQLLGEWQRQLRVRVAACVAWPADPLLAAALVSGSWFGDVSVLAKRMSYTGWYGAAPGLPSTRAVTYLLKQQTVRPAAPRPPACFRQPDDGVAAVHQAPKGY